MTPLETAQVAFQAAEERVRELERESHRIDRERGAARTAGDNALHTSLDDQMHAINIELRIARGAVEEARGRVHTEQRRISRARSTAAELSNRERLLAREAPEAQARAQALIAELAEVRLKRAEAEQQLAQLESPEQPAAVPAPMPVPTPPVERDPVWPQPARTIFDYGKSQYFDRLGNPVDPNGRPLDLPVAPAAQAEPGRTVDPQAAQTAPSLFE